MKKVLFIMIIAVAVILTAFGCTAKENEFAPTEKSGQVGSFSAVTPADGVTLREIPVFSWTEANNADSYTLEIASTTEFSIKDELYIKKSGITTTSFNLVADLKKNQNYYWRVIARNGTNASLIEGEYLSFYYEAILYDEIPLSIGYADEWKVHEVGSKATVALDKSNFFANGKDALTISFDKEDTQRGEEYVESNGWVVVTRSLESEFYGVDAFYFNFYYAGNDATAYFRVIDEDNEYWYAPIKLAMNAKQTIIIRFEEFVLRTKGTPVMNEVFDYNYLKSVEIVFERVDGDGIAYFGDFRAIKYENYKDMFVEGLDFSKLTYTFENYNFGVTVPADGKSYTYAFSGQPNEKNAQGIQGYGFVKFPINKLLSKGDAFAFDLSFMSAENFRNANFLIRVIEEDGDRWSFKIKVSDVPQDGKMLLPYSAFALDEFKGDGFRQFYYVKEIQFGLSENYSGGAITVSDFSIVSLSDLFENSLYTAEIGEDGVIENFESYQNGVEIYYKWQTSTANKDEAIELYADAALGAKNQAAKFGYKTDLPEASYTVYFEPVKGYTAIEISAKDASIKDADATMVVYLQGDVDEWYSYTIENLADDWTSYTIPIAEFALTENSFGSLRISCERISALTISFQYFYPKKGLFDFSDPAQYNSGNYVCIDNIRFAEGEAYSAQEISSKIKPSASDNKIAVISDFDQDDESSILWATSDTASYATLTLSDDTASGEGKSLALGYKTKMETVYYLNTAVDSFVKANGITLLMKGDQHNSQAAIVLYLSRNNETLKYQCTINAISSDWTIYSLGFSSFLQTEGDTFSLTADCAKDITEILINFKNYDANDYYNGTILLDEIKFDGKIALNAKSQAAYAA